RGRVHVLVGAGHDVTGGAQQCGERAHADAAGGDQVHFHESSASSTASWTSGRSALMASLSRRGCTRLVSRITWASRSRSIHSDVPVKPRSPTERAEMPWPALDPSG